MCVCEYGYEYESKCDYLLMINLCGNLYLSWPYLIIHLLLLIFRCITVLQDDSISLNLKETTADQTSSSIFGFAIKNPNCFAMSLLAVLWTKNNIGSEIQKAKILYKKLMVIDNIRFKAWKWKLEKLEFLV